MDALESFTQAAANASLAEQVIVDKAELLAAIRNDCATMLAFYLAEDLTLEVPPVHEEVWAELLELLETVNSPQFIVGTLRKLLAIPRGHAKTTLIKLAVILFMRYSPLSFTAYVSRTFSIALNAIKDIRDWLQSPQETELYGPAVVEKSSETDGLFIMTIHVPGKLTPKRIVLKALGQGTQIRGLNIHSQRPDLLVFDDIEDQSTLEPTVQSKLDSWALGTAIKAMAKRGVVIFIGNMIAETTLLARLTKDPKWNPTVFGSIVRDKEGNLKPLWDGLWTVESLLSEYRDYRGIGQGHVWEAEMMNLTHEAVLSESMGNAIRPSMPNPEDIEAGFICLDPAFGLKSWNDESAITVHVKIKGMSIPTVVQSRTGRMKETQIFDAMVEFSYYWGITSWVIESVAAQRLLIPLFKMLGMSREIPEGVFLYLPVTGGKESKASRITAFRNAVIQQSYAIVEDEVDLADRLSKYSASSAEHDDLCDSAAYGILAWSLYGSIVKDRGRSDVAGLILQNSGMGGPLNGQYDQWATCRF